VIDVSKKKTSVRVIVKDQERNILASMCTLKQFIVNTIVAEVYTTWKTVKFSRN
jgi:carbamate kinase